MRKIQLLSAILVSMFTSSCAALQTSPFPGDSSVPSDLSITLARTACHGKCPIYKLSIKADGSIVFDGERFTQTGGRAEDKISAEKVKQLIAEFKNADYFSFKNSYALDNCPQAATDMSTVKTSIQINNREKAISHYLGCSEGNGKPLGFPQALTDLENKIDEIAETKRWIEERK